ncbi:hypothetical protein ACFX2J_000483 [Malus domestica]
MCSSQPSRIKHQWPLKKSPAKFKIKPRWPLRKSQVRFKIKRPPPLNQIQFKNKLWKVNNWRNLENSPTQFKIKAVESQQAQKQIRANSSTTKAKDHLPHEAPCGPISTFKIKHRRPLKKFQTKFKNKPQRPLKKLSAQFKIKPQRPLNKSPAQFKIKPRWPLDRHLH